MANSLTTCFYRVPTFFIPSNSLIFPGLFPDFLRVFPDFFLVFTKDILVKKTYLFFLNVALVTLVYANIAISWQLLRFNSLKKHFPQIYRFKRFENGLEKKFPDLKFFSLILAEKPLFFPDFPDWKKSSKFSLNSLISLIGGNPVLALCLEFYNSSVYHYESSIRHFGAPTFPSFLYFSSN